MVRPIGAVSVAGLFFDPATNVHLVAVASATGVAAANAPAFQKNFDNGAGSIGLFQKTFAAAARNDIFFELHLPGSWKEGTSLMVHIHAVPLNNNGGDVIWEFEYAFINDLGTITTTTLVTPITTTNAGQYFNKHVEIHLSDVSGVGKLVNSFLIGRISRLGAAGADTYTGEVALLGAGASALFDTVGSEADDLKHL